MKLLFDMLFVAHQTGRIGQPQYGRTINDDLFVTVSKCQIKARSTN